MPLFGTLDIAPVAARLPRVKNLDTEAWSLPKAETLQLAFEVPADTQALLPRAVHPAVPAYATIGVTRYSESPVGPFVLATLRLGARAAAHPRGFVLGAVASTPEAASALRERWGMPAVTGAVALRRRHDRIMATVLRDGQPVLDAALVNPEPISSGDVQFIHSVTLARVVEDGRAVPYLVQVDSHYTMHKAERGRPEVSRFEPPGWNAGSLKLDFPIAASLTQCDTDLPQIRFVMHPETPVVQGTKRIR